MTRYLQFQPEDANKKKSNHHEAPALIKSQVEAKNLHMSIRFWWQMKVIVENKPVISGGVLFLEKS